MKYWILVLLVVFLGCEDKAYIYNSTSDLPKEWSHNQPAAFEFDISDTTSVYDMDLIVNHSQDFGYKNLYVNIVTTFPDGNTKENIISLNIGNNRGGFLGDCDGENCSAKIPLQGRFKFQNIGKHKITIAQHSREEKLKGLNALKLTISKR